MALEPVKDENTEELALAKAVVDPNDIGQIKQVLQDYGMRVSGLSKSALKRLYNNLMTYLETG